LAEQGKGCPGIVKQHPQKTPAHGLYSVLALQILPCGCDLSLFPMAHGMDLSKTVENVKICRISPFFFFLSPPIGFRQEMPKIISRYVFSAPALFSGPGVFPKQFQKKGVIEWSSLR